MDILFFSGVPILLLIGIIGIVLLVRGSQSSREEIPGIGTTRRVFLYGLAFIAIMLATTGITMLLSSIVSTLFTDDISRNDSGQIAFGLAAVIVGFPIWALLWHASAGSMLTYPAEAGSLARKLHIYTVLLVSGVVVAFSASSTIAKLLEDGGFDPAKLAAPLAWAVLWVIHWRWESAEGQPSPTAISSRQFYAYLSAAYGLVMLASGLGMLLYGLLNETYSALFQHAIGGHESLWNDNTRSALANGLAIGLIGGVWWWFHWHRVSAGDHSSSPRLAVSYALGIFGGMITTITGISIFVFSILNWFLGINHAPAADYFDALPAGLAITVVGVAVWVYYRLVAQDDANVSPAQATSAARVYRYLASAVGLGTLGIGIAIEIGLVVGLFADTGSHMVNGGRWWATPLSISLTLILVGGTLWVRHWLMLQTRADATDLSERTAQSRRIYIFSIFGIAVLVTLIAASVVLFRVLLATLDGDLNAEVFNDVKYGIGIVAAAGVISSYHRRVLKEDRGIEAAAQPPEPASHVPKLITVVAPGGASAVIDRMEEKVGIRFSVWERRDDAKVPTLSDEHVDAIANAIASASGQRVLLLIDSNGVQVIPV